MKRIWDVLRFFLSIFIVLSVCGVTSFSTLAFLVIPVVVIRDRVILPPEKRDTHSTVWEPVAFFLMGLYLLRHGM